MKFKGKPNFLTNVVGIGKIMSDDKGYVTTDNADAIQTLKNFGFAEVKEEKKPTEKKKKK